MSDCRRRGRRVERQHWRTGCFIHELSWRQVVGELGGGCGGSYGALRLLRHRCTGELAASRWIEYTQGAPNSHQPFGQSTHCLQGADNTSHKHALDVRAVLVIATSVCWPASGEDGEALYYEKILWLTWLAYHLA